MTNRERQTLERLREQIVTLHAGGRVQGEVAECVKLQELLTKTAGPKPEREVLQAHLSGWACGVQFALDLLEKLDDRPWTALCLN